MREEAQEDDCHLILKAVILIAIFGADFQPMGVECLHSWETNRFCISVHNKEAIIQTG